MESKLLETLRELGEELEKDYNASEFEWLLAQLEDEDLIAKIWNFFSSEKDKIYNFSMGGVQELLTDYPLKVLSVILQEAILSGFGRVTRNSSYDYSELVTNDPLSLINKRELSSLKKQIKNWYKISKNSNDFSHAPS